VPGFWVGRKWVASLATAGAALVLIGSAAADQEQIRLTAEGQAAAKRAILTRADFAHAPGWSGGPVKPNLKSNPPCANFEPKQSDLVVIGAAESRFDHPAGIRFETEAQVFQTQRMVELDWQRTVDAPGAVACDRELAMKQSTAKEKVISFNRVSFPRIATHAARFRVVIATTSQGRAVNVFQDLLLFAKGRTELTISFISALTAESVVSEVEVGVAKKLLARARA
jgi:hypothetical protein